MEKYLKKANLLGRFSRHSPPLFLGWRVVLGVRSPYPIGAQQCKVWELGLPGSHLKCWNFSLGWLLVIGVTMTRLVAFIWKSIDIGHMFSSKYEFF
jgi:hypothetical protein